jgi:rhodanese-related sulfurtransferase
VEDAASEIDLAPDQVAAMLEGEVDLIDVRRDYEWEAGRIAGARHIEVNDLIAAAGSIPRDRPVVFYCRTGVRSGMAADAFCQAGFDAYNMSGGVVAWAESGLPLEPSDATIAEPRPV